MLSEPGISVVREWLFNFKKDLWFVLFSFSAFFFWQLESKDLFFGRINFSEKSGLIKLTKLG